MTPAGPVNNRLMAALIIVDVQYDFIDGSLAVGGAHEILPVVHDLLEKPDWDLVVASQVGRPLSHVIARVHGPRRPLAAPIPGASSLSLNSTSRTSTPLVMSLSARRTVSNHSNPSASPIPLHKD